MNTPDNDGWIAMADRRPKEANLPLLAYYPDGTINLWRELFSMDGAYAATHWQPINLPLHPPKKELTQYEADKLAFSGLRNNFAVRWQPEEAAEYAWHAGISYRDKQNAEDLKLLISDDGYLVGTLRRADATHRLRKRCGLDK